MFSGMAVKTFHTAADIQRESALPIDRENQLSIRDLERRLTQLENLHPEREQATLALGQQVLNDKLNMALNLGLLAISGIILNLGFSVFRLTIQLRGKAEEKKSGE